MVTRHELDLAENADAFAEAREKRIERLETALRRIADLQDEMDGATFEDTFLTAESIAKAALE